MTDLVVSSSDLATFLGSPVDDDRATLILELVGDQAATLVAPLPAEAKGVVLGAAARIYTNPTQVTSESVGPYSASRTFPSVSLTKQERATLRRLAGGGGAFSIDPLGPGYPADRFPE